MDNKKTNGMDQKSTNNNNKRAHDLLEEIFNLWSDISKDENGDELKSPASEEEARKSREILNEISLLDITGETLIQRYDEIKEIIAEYEETFTYQKTANGQAEKLLDEIFNLWSIVSEEDDTEYHSPANDEEVKRSWALISKIEEIDFDDQEIKEQLQTYRGILESYADDDGETSDDEADGDNRLAWEKLEELYSLWSNINIEDGEEYRSPENRKEIKASRALMREIKLLDVTDPDLLERAEELEGVLDSTEAAIPRYTGKIIRSIVYSLVVIIGFFYYPNMNRHEAPEFDYTKEWFVTEKGGYLRWKAFISDKELSDVKQKIYLRSGTELKPIAELGSWLQVETGDGQRGLIKYTLIKGSRYVEAKEKAKVFDKIGAKKKESIEPGTKARVLERTKRKGRFGEELYLKIKLEDGRVKWANDYNFHKLIYKNLPEIKQLYFYPTNMGMVQKHIIGKSLPEIEGRYGTATSVLNISGKRQAYFRHLTVVDQKKHYKGILVNLDANDMAQNIEYTKGGRTQFYDHFPLVKQMRDFESKTVFNWTFYVKEPFRIQWWEDFTDKNWFTGIIGFIVKIITALLIFFLIFLVPWFVVSPLINIFAFNRFFSNGLVFLFSFLVYATGAYLFFTYMIISMDQWIIPAIATIVVFALWVKLYFTRITYNRCPACNTMYSALDEGSTFTGRSTNVSWDTYDVYKGTTESSTTITKNYERRDKKTTETVDSYLDHRMCALCGYQWDVDRDETESHTENL